MTIVSLLRAMIEEEWRLHADLFGGRRFGAFPVAVAAIAAGAFWLLSAVGTNPVTIAAGLHALVGFFGLQVGTIGLVGRDAMRDVLGDVTLLVFSSRTLPVSRRRLLATFVLKDLLYYSALFLAPIALAYAPLALTAGDGALSVPSLWVTLAGTFGLGVGLSLALVGLASRHGGLALAAVALASAAVLASGLDPIALTPYGFYAEPTVAAAVAGFAPGAVVAVLGIALFEPGEETSGRQRIGPLSAYARAIPDGTGLARRTVLSVARSSGSVWKVLFSMGVLVVVVVALLSELAHVTVLDPHFGLALGTVLGLGGFTTYAWLTQFEDPSEILRYPIAIERVFASKRRAYLALVLPAGLAYIAVAALWLPPVELVVAAAVFPGVAVYVFGLTAFVAGLSPTALLFDTPLFAAFGAGLAVVAIPLLVAALATTAAPTLTVAVGVGISVLSGLIGTALARRAGPRWERKLRQ
ncbi:putative membrane protein, predicted permease [Halapricum desulfuricans]|uniref:Putative membrane protein, predicted permease n=1 Tax=Halapricum desulfuricans TaxID=2841257 RepID=A0A897N2E0_9EURY|nr:putative membrane protein, predicted permease [Halapricum desulfuricans]